MYNCPSELGRDGVNEEGLKAGTNEKKRVGGGGNHLSERYKAELLLRKHVSILEIHTGTFGTVR